MYRRDRRRNFMDEFHGILCEIDRLKPEPEVCNASCPPLGCPRGPCPGVCCRGETCDPCCMSWMPRDLSCHQASCCRVPRRSKNYSLSATGSSCCGC
ncbi:keratin-associated protein 5-4-like [Harpegnathos saltator]|uniref:keratin-associated protein 5-4-like n=1 Tax=Harpegnathos saltator TaxID=610380 RepID=UPI000DBEE7B6|nr:keratin-associated protein 5-4-like [Harpegnathos saltator]